MFGKGNGLVCLCGSVAIMLAIFTVPAIAMTAYSITYKEYIEEAGKQFWQIRVTCTDLKTKRFLVQSEDQGQWCAKNLPGFCANDKIQAALNICSSDYELEIDLLEATEVEATEGKSQQSVVAPLDQPGSNKSALLEEQALIQSERIELAQRKLDLRRRELDLQEREIEMLNRIDNLP